MVVEEICLLPFSVGNIRYKWSIETEPRLIKNIMTTPSVSSATFQYICGFFPHARVHIMDPLEALQQMKVDSGLLEGSRYPRFDVAVVTSLEEVD